MADSAREKLDETIAQYINTAKLLKYMEDESREKVKSRSRTRASDLETCDMLKLAAQVVTWHRENLEHCRAIYDAKINNSMPSDTYP